MISFEDDFTGEALNTSTWTVSSYDSIVSEYDGHDALFIADRVAVGDGHLTITTVREPVTFNNVAYNFTSGWLDSKAKRNQTKVRGGGAGRCLRSCWVCRTHAAVCACARRGGAPARARVHDAHPRCHAPPRPACS